MYKPRAYNEIFDESKGLDSLYTLSEIKECIKNFITEKNFIHSDKRFAVYIKYFSLFQ